MDELVYINIKKVIYYPYGDHRISSGSYTNQKQYIGQVYDEDTGLNYLNARYYAGPRGQFISQDPMFWNLSQELLLDPQQMNSYSYARNNPINRSDPSGLFNVKTGAVEKGDTLSKITDILNKTNSTSYTVTQVAKLNNIKDVNKINVGQTLIPNSSVPDITSDLSQKIWTNVGDMGIQNPFYFKSQVQKYGNWDLKNQPGTYCSNSICGGQEHSNYVFLGEKVSYDAPGNIHYGYVGSNTWFGNSSFLHYMADRAQNSDNKTNTGDTASDRNYIDYGIKLFKSGY